MTSNASSPVVAALITLERLFHAGQLTVTVPPWSESGWRGKGHEDSRKIAFHDENVSALVEFSLPPNDKSLPAPSDPAAAVYQLPIPAPSPQDDDEERGPYDDSYAQAPAPFLLRILLASLAVTMQASYTAALPPGSTNKASGALRNGTLGANQSVPSTSKVDAAYASVPIAVAPGQGEGNPAFFKADWAGNQGVVKDEAQGDKAKARNKRLTSSAQDEAREQMQPKGAIWFEEQRWKVQWPIKVPVVYLRSQHSQPILLLTSTLTLRLSATSLAYLLPMPLAPGSAAALWNHDLLSSLSEGPTYPDESAEERHARSQNILARLPLGKFSGQVLGSKLVTPLRGSMDLQRHLEAVGGVVAQDDENTGIDGAEAAITGAGPAKAASGKRQPSAAIDIETDMGELAVRRPSNRLNRGSSMPGHLVDGGQVGQEIKTLRRSARCALEVRSGISVRMRTTRTWTPPAALRSQRKTKRRGDKEGVDGYRVDVAEEDEAEEHAEAGLDSGDEEEEGDRDESRALVLCVEIENPTDSGILFDVRSVEVKIASPVEPIVYGSGEEGLSLGTPKPSATLLEELTGDEEGLMPFCVLQGEQRNLVYYVTFRLPEGSGSVSKADAQRHVSIVIDGRPQLLVPQEARIDEDDATSKTEDTQSRSVPATDFFTSTWNCSLDMGHLLDAVDRQHAAVLGSGIDVAPYLAMSSAPIVGSAKLTARTLRQAQLEQDHAGSGSGSRYPSSTRPAPSRMASGLAPAPLALRTRALPFSPVSISSPRTPTARIPGALDSPVTPTAATGRWPTSAASTSYFGLQQIRTPTGDFVTSPSARTPSSSTPTAVNGMTGGLLARAQMRAMRSVAEAEQQSSLATSNQRHLSWADGGHDGSNSTGVPSIRTSLVEDARPAATAAAASTSSSTWAPLTSALIRIGEAARSASRGNSVLSTSAANAASSQGAGINGGGGAGGKQGGRFGAFGSGPFGDESEAPLYKVQVLPWGIQRSAIQQQQQEHQQQQQQQQQQQGGMGQAWPTSATSMITTWTEQHPDRAALLVSTRVVTLKERRRELGRGGGEQATDAKAESKKASEKWSSSRAGAHVVELDEEFDVEVLVSNRGELPRSILVSWEEGSEAESDFANGGFGGGGEAAKRMLDAEAIRRQSLSLSRGLSQLGVLAEQNHLSVGPLVPGTCDTLRLRLRAMMRGTWNVGNLVVTDVESGVQRVLAEVGTVLVR